MPVVYSTHVLHPAASALLEPHATLKVASALDFETLTAESADADIVIVRSNLPEAMFDAARPLRAAIRHGAGLDMVPMEAATAAGVIVANVPGVNARTVAEHVLFAAMALLRNFRVVDRDLRQKGWNPGRAHVVHGHELAGRTVGIVGMGDIGRQVARIARDGFDLEVLAVARPSSRPPEDIAALPLEEVAGRADILVLSCPLTAETRGMVDAALIARMKQSAILINVSRGAVIDDPALIGALREGRIAGAALDVFAEQPLPADHPYLGFDNVLVTPHMAGISEESMMRMGVGAAEETLRVLDGLWPRNWRNPDVEARFTARFGPMSNA
ncbi:MAG: hydroxyacid dehydrogenase [Rhizobiaceae bacterium]|nr:hydroxyacid dehydrogenase [Rhizobiaceae bacterium]MCV0405682.1 hydroxyacid dehydrogenase [Rhizobiaceae bacterium]